MEKKENRAYYFSVEGETEERYLEWLEKILIECGLLQEITNKPIDPNSEVDNDEE